MNEIIKTETQRAINGVDGRAFAVVANTETGRILNQKFKTYAREYSEHGTKYRISAELRFDDQCGNGHETFSITGTVDRYERGRWQDDAGGCIHGEIAKHFPALVPLIKWHLVSTDGPLHYIANTVYLAGDRDCNGLRNGEARQIKNGRTGQPAWHLVAVDSSGAELELHKINKYIDADHKPECPYTLEYRPWLRVGEGKARELDHARSSAVWPEATDAELMQEPEALKAVLNARLPALLAAFKADIIATGFVWPEASCAQ